MFSEINKKTEIIAGAKGKRLKNIIKTNKSFSIRVLYIRYGVYDIVFTYQETTVFQPISDEQYLEYRKLCYLRPIRAKNYLLDLVNLDGTPYNRGDFQFIGRDDEPTKAMIALWQEIEKNLFGRNNQHT
ncbi:hypothetical protein [Bacteroides thetaiotaomicron]|uniref:hypothetical protein n=1 Tax=Bacteroides thetaiotaomicron TaxID=818 RepID=UPI0032C1450D